ncbi:putative serine threonine protein kinase domain protein [Golovinomyces cichoracearum]|uniref:Putative serine threonine protein kinase domain protein n=1 Tax=Golovinomyces cichoracearum TaxID=62708 RepID=A0A420HB71_9PEZI|nr:putative serine threonine protein kinase domain protein [Golovinomyces cichoracearum]
MSLSTEQIENLYQEEFDPTAHSTPIIRKFCDYAFKVYVESELKYSTLASQFALDFMKFKEEDFEKIRKEDISRYRQFLRKNGVCVNVQRFVKLSKTLAYIIEHDTPWPDNDPDRPIHPAQQMHPFASHPQPANKIHFANPESHKNLKTSPDRSPGPSFPQNLPPLPTFYNQIPQNDKNITQNG